MSGAERDRPWEPPVAGDEAEQLLGALDRQRWTFRYKADGLDADGLTARVGASSLTLAGLLKHLAVVEDVYASERLRGAPLPEMWQVPDWEADDNWDFTSAAEDAPEELYAMYDGAVARSRTALAEVVAERGLDGAAHSSTPDGRHASVRRVLLDLLEEYGRHTGHADLLREAVDGRVGEDPPSGWRPTSGSWQVR